MVLTTLLSTRLSTRWLCFVLLLLTTLTSRPTWPRLLTLKLGPASTVGGRDSDDTTTTGVRASISGSTFYRETADMLTYRLSRQIRLPVRFLPLWEDKNKPCDIPHIPSIPKPFVILQISSSVYVHRTLFEPSEPKSMDPRRCFLRKFFIQ